MKRKINNFNEHIIKEKRSKYQLSLDKENERCLNLYPDLKFSPRWTEEQLPRFMENNYTSFEEEYKKWKIYYTKNLLEPFIIFYNEYKPYSYPKIIRNYELYYNDNIKEQYDKIINGELFVDVEFQRPESPIRNYMKIYYFDKMNIDYYNKNK